MKKQYALIILFLFSLTTWAQSSITSITIVPANPTPADSILIIANTSFPSGDCPLDYKNHQITEKTILALTHHCLGVAAYICSAVDTFSIGKLAPGTYKFDLTLTSGGLPIPCTPGIVIDDQDSIFFTVANPAGMEEYSPESINFENPVSDRLQFNAPLDQDAFLFSSTGQIVKHIEAGEYEVNVSGLMPGLYFLQIGTVSRKLLIR